MGAFTHHPPTDAAEGLYEAMDLAVLAHAAEGVLRGSAAEVQPQLLPTGGSPGGAKPKVLVGVKGNELITGEGDLPAGFAHWMVKFRAQKEDKDTGPLELAYALLARRAGIEMPPTRLFPARAGVQRARPQSRRSSQELRVSNDRRGPVATGSGLRPAPLSWPRWRALHDRRR